MSNDYSNVGFEMYSGFETAASRKRFKAAITCGQTKCNEPYEVLRAGNKIELWFYADNENNIIDYYCEIAYRNGIATDVVVNNWISGKNEIPPVLQIESAVCPLNIIFPEAFVKDVAEGDKLEMQLSLLCQNAEIFSDEDEYYFISNIRQSDIKPAAAESIFSVGTIENNTDAIISGTVESASIETNPLTGMQFYEIVIRCQGVLFTIVADLEFFDEIPEKGNVIRGRFMVVGVIGEL